MLKLCYDRQSVGQSVLVSGTHLGYVTNFPFSLKLSLDSCGFILKRPLWRENGSVIYCCCWFSPAQFRSISRPYFIVPILETSPTWRARSPYLYPPGTGWPRYAPEHWVLFPSRLTTRRAAVEVFYPALSRWSKVDPVLRFKVFFATVY
jgi:hypothetical protein